MKKNAVPKRFMGLSDKQILDEGRKIAQDIRNEVGRVVFGPELQALTEVLTLALFADGHVVVRAPVGLAKTLACNALAKTISGKFNKRQFRPDMQPMELSGYEYFNEATERYEVRHGPLYGANLFLADEINRGTPKLQSALLEAMEEGHLTVGTDVIPLEQLFMVLATRNPQEHQGVYQLPEAQLDRFFAQAVIKNISLETGMRVLSNPDYWRSAGKRLTQVQSVTSPEEILFLREKIFTGIIVEPRLDNYILRIVEETHNKPDLIESGSSPRGSINLKKAATVNAFLAGRQLENGVQIAAPEDVIKSAVDVLAHRIFLKEDAKFDNKDLSPAKIVRKILDDVKYE